MNSKIWVVRGKLENDFFYIDNDILKEDSINKARVSVKNTFIKDLYEITPGDKCILTDRAYKNYIFICNIIDKESNKLKIKIIDKIHRENLPDDTRKALRVPRSIIDARNIKEINKILNNLSSINKVNVSFPLRPDFTVNFYLPSDITKEEANKLSEFLKLVYF